MHLQPVSGPCIVSHRHHRAAAGSAAGARVHSSYAILCISFNNLEDCLCLLFVVMVPPLDQYPDIPTECPNHVMSQAEREAQAAAQREELTRLASALTQGLSQQLVNSSSSF